MVLGRRALLLIHAALLLVLMQRMPRFVAPTPFQQLVMVSVVDIVGVMSPCCRSAKVLMFGNVVHAFAVFVDISLLHLVPHHLIRVDETVQLSHRLSVGAVRVGSLPSVAEGVVSAVSFTFPVEIFVQVIFVSELVRWRSDNLKHEIILRVVEVVATVSVVTG